MIKQNFHHCPALALLCIDFRFWQATLKFVKNQLKIKSFDLLALAGGAKSLASPTKKIYRQTVLDNIKISVQLHRIKKIILINHQDCGAYGGSQRFKSLKEEITFHQKELRKAGRLLKKVYPKLRTFGIFVFRTDHNNFHFKMVK